MKILLFRVSCRGVNAETSFYNRQEIGLAKALVRRGHECDVAYFGGKVYSEKELSFDDGVSIRIRYLQGIGIYDAGLYFNLDDIIAPYDVIQVSEYDQVTTWLLASRHPEKTVVYHGTYYSPFNRRYNMKCRFVDAFFVGAYKRQRTPFLTKSTLAKRFLEARGIKDVAAVGVGLDRDQIAQSEEASHTDLLLRIQEGVEDGAKHLLYVGRLEPRRNPFFLLEVFRGIRLVDPQIRLVIVGDGKREYHDALMARASEFGFSWGDDILYERKMPQNELAPIYRACDTFVLPTYYEIFGMVLLEAMWFGLPVITTCNGGSDMLLHNNGAGIVLKDFDVIDWCGAVEAILRDDDFAAQLASNARQVVEHFTWDSLADRFEAAYESLSGLRGDEY